MKEKSHNKKKEVKALIIRDILRREFSGQGLRKSEIEEDMKGFGIPKPNFEFHLYSRKKHQEGLIPKKVIKSKKGNLSLNLKSLKSLTTIIEYLENDPDYGEKVRYLLDRAFIEAFFSEYGDMLKNNWRLIRFLNLKLRKILVGNGYSDPSESEAMWTEFNREIIHRIFPRMSNLVPETPESASLDLSKDEINNKVSSTLNGIDLLGYMIEFSQSLRGDDSLEFKIAYIIKAMKLSEWVNELKSKNDELLMVLKVAEITLVALDNDEIVEMSNIDESMLKLFMEKVIKKAFDKNIEIDRSLRTDLSLLELLPFKALKTINYLENEDLRTGLNEFLYPYLGGTRTFNNIYEKRKKLGLPDWISFS